MEDIYALEELYPRQMRTEPCFWQNPKAEQYITLNYAYVLEWIQQTADGGYILGRYVQGSFTNDTKDGVLKLSAFVSSWHSYVHFKKKRHPWGMPFQPNKLKLNLIHY
jgi:hypothetical protein